MEIPMSSVPQTSPVTSALLALYNGPAHDQTILRLLIDASGAGQAQALRVAAAAAETLIAEQARRLVAARAVVSALRECAETGDTGRAYGAIESATADAPLMAPDALTVAIQVAIG